jgi:beta-lactamase regulating signal transducer with metallopeptidase domain
MTTHSWSNDLAAFLAADPLLQRLFFASVELATLAIVTYALIRLLQIWSPRIVSLLWLTILIKPIVSLTVGTPFSIVVLEKSAPAAGKMNESFSPSQTMNFQTRAAPQNSFAGSFPEESARNARPVESPAKPASAEGFAAAPPTSSPGVRSQAEWTPQRRIISVWAAGVILFLGWHILGRYRLRQIKRQGRPLSEAGTSHYRQLAAELGLQRLPRVIVTEALESPAIFGLVKPTILIPSWLAADASHPQFQWSLRHELTHWKWLDPFAILVRDWSRIIFYFHPAAWFSGKRMVEAVELACDRAMVHDQAEAGAYAEQLYGFLIKVRKHRRISVPGGLFATRTQIGKRIAALLDGAFLGVPQMPKLSVSGLVVFGAIALAFGCAIGSSKEDGAAVKSNQAASPVIQTNAVPDGPPGPRFGPVVHLTLSAGNSGNSFATLDDRKLHSSASTNKPCVGVGQDEKLGLFISFENIHNYLDEQTGRGIERWRHLSAADHVEEYRRAGFALLPFEQNGIYPIRKEKLPMTFNLPTAGLLQVTEIVEGSPPSVRIHYKLVSRGNPEKVSGLTVQPVHHPRSSGREEALTSTSISALGGLPNADENNSAPKQAADGQTPTLQRHNLKMTGKVVDAQSRQPIKTFTITPGRIAAHDLLFWFKSKSSLGQDGVYRVEYGYEALHDLQKMTFKVTVGEAFSLIKVEAPGYKPEMSATFYGRTNWDFELRKGDGFTGTVVGLDGRPMAGAQVGYNLWWSGLPLNGRKLGIRNFGTVDHHQSPVVTSDNRGCFTLPALPGAKSLIVFHEQGFAEIQREYFEQLAEIRLQPWNQTEATAAAEGFQVRLQADRTRWMAGETPELRADILNLGRQNWQSSTNTHLWQIEVDGKWYITERDSALLDVKRTALWTNRPLALNDTWRMLYFSELQSEHSMIWDQVGMLMYGRGDGRNPMVTTSPLTLPPGKHTIRLSVFATRPTGTIRATSNPLEIEIAEKKHSNAPKPRPNQGANSNPNYPNSAFVTTSADESILTPPAGNGIDIVQRFQVSLRADQRMWRFGERPILRASVSNLGPYDYQTATNDSHTQIEVDGRWYCAGNFGALLTIKAGESWTNHHVVLSSAWRTAHSNELSTARYWGSGISLPSDFPRHTLKLTPGKHTIRVAMIATPAYAGPAGPVRAISNPVEIEILPLKEWSSPGRSELNLKPELSVASLGKHTFDQLALAEQELERKVKLHATKHVSGRELDQAGLLVELRKAELTGDSDEASRVRLQLAEGRLFDLAELRKQNRISEAELRSATDSFESAIRSLNARQSAEAFLFRALGAGLDQAIPFLSAGVPPSPMRFLENLKSRKFAIAVVHDNASAMATVHANADSALAITAGILAYSTDGKRTDGPIVLTLKRSEKQAWQVWQVDIKSAAAAQLEVQQFLRDNPDAKLISPSSSSGIQ